MLVLQCNVPAATTSALHPQGHGPAVLAMCPHLSEQLTPSVIISFLVTSTTACHDELEI